MRKAYSPQRRFDCSPIAKVPLNFECRDEVVPVLAGLQFLYRDNQLRRRVVNLVADDVSSDSRRDVERPGFDDWHVVVLAAVRLGCNYDYDKLQDQAQNHLGLRGILGIGDWECAEQFGANTKAFAEWAAEHGKQVLTEAQYALVSFMAASVNDGCVARLLVFEASATPPRRRATVQDVPKPILEAANWWAE